MSISKQLRLASPQISTIETDLENRFTLKWSTLTQSITRNLKLAMQAEAWDVENVCMSVQTSNCRLQRSSKSHSQSSDRAHICTRQTNPPAEDIEMHSLCLADPVLRLHTQCVQKRSTSQRHCTNFTTSGDAILSQHLHEKGTLQHELASWHQALKESKHLVEVVQQVVTPTRFSLSCLKSQDIEMASESFGSDGKGGIMSAIQIFV